MVRMMKIYRGCHVRGLDSSLQMKASYVVPLGSCKNHWKLRFLNLQRQRLPERSLEVRPQPRSQFCPASSESFAT